MKKITQQLLFLTLAITGLSGYAQSSSLKFDGTNYLSTTNSGNRGALRNSANHSWEMWVKGPSTTTGIMISEGNDASGANSQFWIQAASGTNAGKINLLLRDGLTPTSNVVFNIYSSKIVFDNAWHHVAVVGSTDVNGTTTTTLYIDGIVDGAAIPTYGRWNAWIGGASVANQFSANPPSMNNFTIGSRSNHATGTNIFYNGYIDEVRTWDRALTQQEIRDNACGPLTLPATGLRYYFELNETTGNTFAETAGANAYFNPNPTALVGNTPTFDTRACINLGTQSFEKNNLNVSIEKNNDVLTITAPEARTITAEVYDITGKVVDRTKSTTNVAKVSLGTAKGMYIVKITDGKASFTQKVVK